MDHLSRSLLNCYTLHAVDRHAERRGDKSWVDQQLAQDSAGAVVIWRGQTLVAGSDDDVALSPLSLAEARELPGAGELVLLGVGDHGPRFAMPLDGALADTGELLERHGALMDLRRAGRELSSADSAMFAHAKALAEWQQRNGHCPACGGVNEVIDAGHVLKCTNEHCGRSQFPRMDPAIIVRVVFEDRILLGRQAVWAEHQYSVVAGFVEPGESLEQAVVREVYEETGVPVSEVHYQSSQPWPFPGNIMLGFAAVASGDAISLIDKELEDARWFTRDQIISGLHEKSLRVPPNISISFRLIEHWFNEGSDETLLDVTRRAGYEWAPAPSAQ